jgi:exocyst complex component 1
LYTHFVLTFPLQSDQVKGIEQTKVASKKRRGIAHFIKYFPSYVNRVENQLLGADGFEIRVLVDAAYEKIVQAMLDTLKQLAKLDGEGEDKGQLNYHIVILGMYQTLPSHD